MEEQAEVEKIATWLVRAAARQGLTLNKILKSSSLDLSSLPRRWPHRYSAARVFDLICEAAKKLPERDSAIALVALNQFPGVGGSKLSERFENLARSEALGPSKEESPAKESRDLVKRWSKLRIELARRIRDEMNLRERDGWEKYVSTVPKPGESELQPFVVDRLEVTYFVDERRVCTHTITQRWISVDLADAYGTASVDHYKVRARYTDASGRYEHEGVEILPMINCRAGSSEVGRDGWLMTEMKFPEPLRNGQKLFFASLVKYSTVTPMDPPALIQVTSHGILQLIMRVQFHVETAPRACWVYGGREQAVARVAPGDGQLGQWRLPNQLGFVEYDAKNCPAGWFYAIGWKWD